MLFWYTSIEVDCHCVALHELSQFRLLRDVVVRILTFLRPVNWQHLSWNLLYLSSKIKKLMSFISMLFISPILESVSNKSWIMESFVSGIIALYLVAWALQILRGLCLYQHMIFVPCVLIITLFSTICMPVSWCTGECNYSAQSMVGRDSIHHICCGCCVRSYILSLPFGWLWLVCRDMLLAFSNRITISRYKACIKNANV